MIVDKKNLKLFVLIAACAGASGQLFGMNSGDVKEQLKEAEKPQSSGEPGSVAAKAGAFNQVPRVLEQPGFNRAPGAGRPVPRQVAMLRASAQTEQKGLVAKGAQNLPASGRVSAKPPRPDSVPATPPAVVTFRLRAAHQTPDSESQMPDAVLRGLPQAQLELSAFNVFDDYFPPALTAQAVVMQAVPGPGVPAQHLESDTNGLEKEMSELSLSDSGSSTGRGSPVSPPAPSPTPTPPASVSAAPTAESPKPAGHEHVQDTGNHKNPEHRDDQLPTPASRVSPAVLAAGEVLGALLAQHSGTAASNSGNVSKPTPPLLSGGTSVHPQNMETTHDDTLEISQGAKANPQETDSLVCLWATKCAAYALEARDFALHNTVMRGLRNIGEVYALNKFFKESVLECLRMVSYGDYACLGNEAANVTVVDPQVLALLAAAAALVDLGWSAKDSIDYVLAEY